jgi:hypothetical protein
MRPRGLPVLLAPIVLLTMFVDAGRAPARAWRPPPQPVADTRACVRPDDTVPGAPPGQAAIAARPAFATGGQPAAGRIAARQSARQSARPPASPPVRARHGLGHGAEPSSGQTQALDHDLWRRLRERHGGTDLSDLEYGPRRPGRIVVPVRFHMIT